HQGAVAHGGTVYQRHVPDGDIIAEGAGGIGVDVEDAVVLDVGARADADGVDIPAQDHPIENGGIRADLDVTDDGGVRGDPGGFVDAWGFAVEGQDQGSGGRFSHDSRSFSASRVVKWMAFMPASRAASTLTLRSSTKVISHAGTPSDSMATS